jgi:hypothetical protein
MTRVVDSKDPAAGEEVKLGAVVAFVRTLATADCDLHTEYGVRSTVAAEVAAEHAEPAGEQENTPSAAIEAVVAAVSMAVLADSLLWSLVEETSIVDYDYIHCSCWTQQHSLSLVVADMPRLGDWQRIEGAIGGVQPAL